VKILEVLPLNFYQKDNARKNRITDGFYQFFKTCPENIHIKSRTEKADTAVIINTIRENYRKINNPLLTERAEDHIKHILSLRNTETFDRRYYVIFQYEGSNGSFSKKFEDIYATMRTTEMGLRQKLYASGNMVVIPDNPDLHACEVLYKFYNPVSCATESIRERIGRICYDYEQIKGKDSEPSIADYVAPRGLVSKPSRDWLLMDGMYHTFLVLRDNSFPGIVQTGWVDSNIPNIEGVDVDIIARRVNRTVVDNAVKQLRKFKSASLRSHAGNTDKEEELVPAINNATYIKESINAYDEDLFYCMIIITIRSTTFAGMRDITNHIKSQLDGMSIYTTPSFLTAHEFLRNVAPDMYYNKSFQRKFSHNLLTRNMAQLYFFTAVSLFDNEGFVIGSNNDGNSIVSFNNFNTSKYSNANIVVMGPSGSGKSYFEMMLGYGMYMSGIRVMYILPLKGHEYHEACNKIGGEYIKFMPGSNVCVNIMEIRPQVTADGSLLEDADDMEGLETSLLARKISSLCTWLQLNMLDDKLSTTEKNQFSVLCTKLYANYGITSNNDSIWLDKKNRVLKKMPILQDLNDALQDSSALSRIKDVLSPYMYNGIFQNFNGPTNVDLDNRFLVFDVDKLSINEDYLPAMMYIAYDCCYDLARQSLNSKDAIFMDEVWLMMRNKDCAKQVQEMVKIIRGYGACTVLATQDIGDFLRSNEGLGESILASTKIRFFMKCEDIELANIARVVNLTRGDMAKISSFPAHGQAFMMASDDKYVINLIASPEQSLIFTTDVNKRKEKKHRKTQGLS